MVEQDMSRSEVRDNMRIAWDVPIRMEDGVVLRADIYRPDADGKFPVLMTYGPYGKGLAWQDKLYESSWQHFSSEHPDAIEGSSNLYQSWETVDPEHWVPEGYICIRVDSRGAGRSPGYLDVWSARETEDFAQCIDWAGVQPWSNGKVGLAGISYYGMNQWWVAGRQPKHLAAMCPWEAASDYYREFARHGGILHTFLKNWFATQVRPVQHGVGDNGFRSRVHGETVAGPETLSQSELDANCADIHGDVLSRELIDEWYRARQPDFSALKTPLLSAASWGGQGLHPRGNYEGFMQAATEEKWLECHGLEHWTEFYTPYGRNLQKQFFGYFLKGEKNGWDQRPRVMLKVRHVGERFVERGENEWPLARTEWTKFYLDSSRLTLESATPRENGATSYNGFEDGVTYFLPPFSAETEITGPMSAKLFVSSATEDADLFLVVRMFTPDMKEVTFQGTVDPHTPIGQGWLRVSHRKLDPEKSALWRPFHTHDEKQPMTPGEIYEVDVEIWPTCIVIPVGYRIALTIRGKDYVYPGAAAELSNFAHPLTGCGPFLHDDPDDRPESTFGGKVTVHSGPNTPSYLLLPIIPGERP